VAKSKSGEFYTFDEVLKQLQIDENRLKRLVSEGEIRAFREGDQMRFKRSEIDTLAGRSGTGGSSSDTSLTEISLEDDSQPTVNVGAGVSDTLADDLAAEPEAIPSIDVSSQDTYIDQGDIGMSTEPIDFTDEDELGDEAEAIEDMGVDKPGRRGGGRPAPAGRPRPVATEESKLNVIFVIVLAFAVIAGGWAALVNLSISRGHSNSITGKAVELFGSEQE
jgi:excisionase family DNA binding protein